MLQSIGRRLQRLLRLDWQVFREISVDEAATREAALIVGVAALLSAFPRPRTARYWRFYCG